MIPIYHAVADILVNLQDMLFQQTVPEVQTKGPVLEIPSPRGHHLRTIADVVLDVFQASKFRATMLAEDLQ